MWEASTTAVRRRKVQFGLVLLHRIVVVQRLLQFVVDCRLGGCSGVFGGKVAKLVRRDFGVGDGWGRLAAVLLTVLRRRFDPLHLGPKSVNVVGRVLHYAGGAVRLDQAVRALDRPVTVAHLVLALLVPGHRVVDRVLEVISRAGLVRGGAGVIAVLDNDRRVVVQWRRRLERKRRGHGARGHDEHCDRAAIRQLKNPKNEITLSRLRVDQCIPRPAGSSTGTYPGIRGEGPWDPDPPKYHRRKFFKIWVVRKS